MCNGPSWLRRLALCGGYLFDDPLEILPQNQPPANPRKTKICCEFCDCELTPTGEVMRLGEKARGYRDAGDAHERAIKAAEKTLADANAELERLRAEKRDRDAANGSRGLHF